MTAAGMRRLACAGAIAAAAWVVIAGSAPAHAQGIATGVEGAPPLEAISIRPSAVTQGPMRMRANPGRVDIMGATLQQLISNAFGEPGAIPPFRLAGLPSWASETRFDIQATVAGGTGPLSPSATLLGLRSLLLDRFKLKVHMESREADVYLLMPLRAGSTGPALKRTALDCTVAGAMAPLPAAGAQTAQPCDAIRIRGGAEFVLEAWGTTLARLATQLSASPVIARPVLDRTGLDGRFDAVVRFTAPPASAPDAASVTTDVSAPSLPIALEEQLGLKLQPARAPVDVLVIDSAAQPDQN